MSEEVARLSAIVSDLSTKVARLPSSQGSQNAQNEPTGALTVPFYEVVEAIGSTLTFTSMTDWGPQFDDTSLSNRVVWQQVTSAGELKAEDGIATYAQRFKISWDADNAYQVTCLMTRLPDNNDPSPAGGDGTVQVIHNGKIVEHSIASSYFTLDVKAGRNSLQIVRPYDLPDSFKLCAKLFDGKMSRFVSPR